MEIELKFRLDAATARKAAHVLARLPGAGTPAAQALDAAYFDTRNGDLRKAGLTLRVRQENGAFVQTVKRAGSFARAEWSDKVRGPTPDRDAGKSGRRLARAIKDADDATLRARFRVKVTRTTVAILSHGAVIEAAVDTGFIQAHGQARRLPVHELELELKSGGAPAVLHDLALDLVNRLSLRLEGLSKSDRGYALAAGAFPAPVRKKRLSIRRGATLGEILRDAGRAYLGQFSANMAAVEDGQAEGVHQMRVALRRLRGILKAADDRLPPADYAWVDERFKHVLQELGPARNWDVLRETLTAAPDLAHRRTAAHRRLMTAAEARRRAAHSRAAAQMMSPVVTRTMLEIGRWFEGLPARSPDAAMPVTAAAPELLARAQKRFRKKGRHFARLTPDQRHKLRIAGKNLRYAAELFVPLYGAGRAKTFLRRLKSAQDVLGALNDIQGAHALLRPLAKGALGAPAGEVLGWLDRKAAGLAKRASEAVKKARKSRGFWQSGRD